MTRKLAALFCVVLVFSLVCEVVEAGLLDRLKAGLAEAKYGLGKSKDDFKNGVKQDVRNKILGITQDPMCHVAVDQAHDCLAKVSLCLQGTYVPLMNRICKQTCCQQIKMYG